MTLVNKRAVVTGASRGIGQDIALGLARAGAKVAISARNQDELDVVALEIGQQGGECLVVTCDVTAVTQVEALRNAVKSVWGGVDILVNNAGIAASHKFITHPDKLWHKIIDVNLNGVYYVTKAFAPDMAAQNWGRIITIASIASKAGAPYIAAYTAAKHGVLGLTRALAAELVGNGITVNAICPGYVDTPMTEQTIESIVSRTGMPAEKARAILEKSNPQNRLTEVDEITAAVLYLASDAARGINGQALNVDGGAVMF